MRIIWTLLLPLALAAGEPPWARHTIDSTSRGADGVRLADVNGDGLQDIATGWEEGGRVRVYLNPGPREASKAWPAVTAGQVGSPEDAVFVDLDRNGAWDVVSSTEGREQTLYVHWAPKDHGRYLDAAAWTTEAIPQSRGLAMWMFVLPADVDGRDGIDFFAGSKEQGARIGWWRSPADPRRLADWTWHPLYEAGWIMSLLARDMDGDGDEDLVATDRKGSRRGVLWLENPGAGAADGPWREHRIGPVDQAEVMFLTLADLDGDGLDDAIAATSGGPIVWFRRRSAASEEWERFEIAMPPSVGTGKAVAVADVDLDGRLDLLFTCENAKEDLEGVMWLSRRGAVTDPAWDAHAISGPVGVKFDRIELLDLDADGDLDLLTCEERDNLGVIWYENPGTTAESPRTR